MKIKMLQWFAIVLIIQMGLLHFFTAQREYEEAAYVGYLFMANFMGALIAAYGIYYKQAWGWLLGLVLATGSIAGYVLSRTVGMPGMAVEERMDPYGVVAVLVEALIILLVLLRPWRMNAVVLQEEQTVTPGRQRYLFPVSALVVIGFISLATYLWDVKLNEIPLHEHVGTLDQVCSTPLTSLAELKEKYGIEVSLVVITEMGGIVDVRLKIVDPDKAHALLVNQAALLVNQQALILAPHLHNHYKMKPDKLYFMFFSSQRSLVHAGSSVSLVFGRTRVEPILVQ